MTAKYALHIFRALLIIRSFGAFALGVAWAQTVISFLAD